MRVKLCLETHYEPIFTLKPPLNFRVLIRSNYKLGLYSVNGLGKK